jgi:DNA polymerase-3 subunit alpha
MEVSLRGSGLTTLIEHFLMYYKPRLTSDMIAERAGGLAASTSCLGSRWSKLLLLNRRDEAERLIDHHVQMFEHFFVEVQLHLDEDQQTINKHLIDIARKKNLPLILTNDAHYTHEHDKRHHEMALTIQTNDVLSNPKRFSFGDIDVHVAHHDWMAERAAAQGIPYEAISNTVAMAKLVDDTSYFSDRRNRYPHYKHCADGTNVHQELEYQAKTKLMAKFGGKIPPPEYIERMNTELRIMKMMDVSDYMLIVADIVNTTRDKLDGWVGPGRGSAAGSLVSYALGITQLDPIKYGLLFSRFLQLGRSAHPLIFSPDMVKQVQNLPKPESHHGCGKSSRTPCEHSH